MSVSMSIPKSWSSCTGGSADLRVGAGTVRDILEQLSARYDGLVPRMLDGKGELSRFVSIFVSERDIRTIQHLDTPVADESRVRVVQFVAGG